MVHHQTAFKVTVRRSFDDILDKRINTATIRLIEQYLYPLHQYIIPIKIKRFLKQSILIAKFLMRTGGVQTCCRNDIVHGSSFESLLPKKVYGFFQDVGTVVFFSACREQETKTGFLARKGAGVAPLNLLQLF